MNRKIYFDRGITLIALIVTIIVILILSTITINMVTGENGIIKNANNAKETTEIENEKEIVQRATINAIEKNKYGDITVDGLQNELKGKATVKKIRKKIVVKIDDSERSYYIDDDGNVFEYEYFDLAIMENGYDFHNRMADYRTSILRVIVLDNMNIPEYAYKVFDVSKEQNETVKAWLIKSEENTDMYDLYIGSNEGVEIENCDSMFAYYSNCVDIDISNLYTSKVKVFASMFTWDTNLRKINMENIDTSNATSMYSMFNKCTSLTQLDVSKFDTSNVMNMSAMFYQCAFTEIDLSNFDTSRVTSMNEMFRQCYGIKNLDLSSFNVANVTRTDNMFLGCSNLEKVYANENWSEYANITKSKEMFGGCPKLVGSISYDSTKVDITYANYDIGYFTYKNVLN